MPIPIPTALSTVTGVIAGVTYTAAPGGAIFIEGEQFNLSHPTTTILPNGDNLVISPTGTVTLQDYSVQNVKQLKTVTPRDYVVGAFVPTFLAVLFVIPWHMVAAAVKEMEPFHQLSAVEGALAEKSLTLDYRESLDVIAILKALRHGHFLVWWAGLTSLVALLVAPLASESVFIGFVGSGSCKVGSGRVNCFPQLSVFPPAARALQGILAFIAVMTIGLIIGLLRVKSGVPTNPLSIAGLAGLFQHQPLIDRFRKIDGFMPSRHSLRDSLRGLRCRLGEYRELDGSTRYGISLLSFYGQPREVRSGQQTALHAEKKTTSIDVHPLHEPPPTLEQKRSLSSLAIQPVAVIAFGLLVCGLIVLIVFYKLVGTNTGFERFMDSASFGTSFLFTAIGIIIKSYWILIDDGMMHNCDKVDQTLTDL